MCAPNNRQLAYDVAQFRGPSLLRRSTKGERATASVMAWNGIAPRGCGRAVMPCTLSIARRTMAPKARRNMLRCWAVGGFGGEEEERKSLVNQQTKWWPSKRGRELRVAVSARVGSHIVAVTDAVLSFVARAFGIAFHNTSVAGWRLRERPKARTFFFVQIKKTQAVQSPAQYLGTQADAL